VPQLIVFDLDGTLVDSRKDLANATNALIVELGGAPLAEEAVVAMVGEGAGVLVRRALSAAKLRAVPEGALPRFLELYRERELDHTRAYPGVAAALDHLAAAGVAMSVLTNKPEAPTLAILDGLGLRRHFRDVVGGDSAFGRKPDPAGLRHLMGGAGATPESTVLVGDSRVDFDTARAAGTKICLARYGFGFRFGPEDFRGDESFLDVPGDLVGLL
jgi:phosphoglycolate phosphatase